MFKPKYITTDDFRNYWGPENDLVVIKGSEEAADSFLYRTEDRLMNWIDATTFRIIKYEELSEYQLDQFRKALLTQAMYNLRAGDVGLDSGYDMEKGIVARRADLIVLEVPTPVIDYLKNAGLFNLVVKNRIRHIGLGGFR